MQRLRSTWLALVGGAFLLALSVSAAFGAPPTGEDAPRGQTVAAFVHELVFGSDEETDEEVVDDADTEVVDETEFSSHDECVSAEAEDKSDETAEDGNHGHVVSFAAQVTCVVDSGAVITDPEEGEDVEEQQLEDEREVPEGFDNHGDCVSQATHDEDGFDESDAANFGEWVSQHARFICWSLPVPGADAEDVTEGDTQSSIEGADTDAEEMSAKEERQAEKAAAREVRKAAAKARAGGHGRGGGRP